MKEINYILRGQCKFGEEPTIVLTRRDKFSPKDFNDIPKLTPNGRHEYYTSISYIADDNEMKREVSFIIFGDDYTQEQDKIIDVYSKGWKDMLSKEHYIKLHNDFYFKLFTSLVDSLQSFINEERYVDISKCDNIYDLFNDDIEYPENSDLLDGVSMNTNYSYVSTTYLNGFINYVNIFHAIMIRRYQPLEPEGQDKGWEKACEYVNERMKGFHSNISESCEMDDILILAESDDSYWLFWDDCDCSDSCIGRLDKKLYRKEDLIELLNRSVPNLGDNNEEYIILPKFSGWVTL